MVLLINELTHVPTAQNQGLAAHWNHLSEWGKPGLVHFLLNLGLKGNKSWIWIQEDQKVFPTTQSRSQTDLTNIFPVLLTATPSASSALGLQGNNSMCLPDIGRQAEPRDTPVPRFFQCLMIFSRNLAYCHMRNSAGQETRYQLQSITWVWEFFPSGVRNQLHVMEVKFSFNIEICHFQDELWSLRCLNIFLEDQSQRKSLGRYSPSLTGFLLAPALPVTAKRRVK